MAPSTPAARTIHAAGTFAPRGGKGRSPHLPGIAREGACIYQIDELEENASGEKPGAYVPPVASKRVFPNVMHSASVSAKHVAL